MWYETYIHRWDGKNGIAGIIKAAKAPSQPRPKRHRKAQMTDLEALIKIVGTNHDKIGADDREKWIGIVDKYS